jgi:hypothetical protein
VLINVDVQGTLVNNPRLTDAEALQAVQDMSEAGHRVRLVSASPGEASRALGGAEVADKWGSMARAAGLLVDDDALRAEQLGGLAVALCSQRHRVRDKVEP